MKKKSLFVDYKNTRIHSTDQGKGPVVVLLHGFLENVSMWDDLAEVLSKRNRVVCIDLLGHGQSENLGYLHTMEQMSEVVAAVLKFLRVRKSIVVGHSMGGYVALAFAECFPNKVKGLCLLNSTACADSLEKQQNRDRAISVVKKNHISFIKTAVPLLFRSKNRILFNEAILKVKNEALKTSKQGVIAALEGMKIRQDKVAVLRSSHFKKMMILGEKDPVLNLASLLRQAEGTNTTLMQLSEGHMSLVENKEETIAAIKNFVKSCCVKVLSNK
jgi:pimeloyl-ACP methyl ester carboxylesterase